MQARSALFDLYGDHLRPRGGRAPVAALVRLLAPLGIAAPAVRTAVSRMVRQGWLIPVRLAPAAGYQLTVRAVHRLDEAAARIYRTEQRRPGTARFDLLLLAPTARTHRMEPGHRHADLPRVRQPRPATWVAPRAADEVDALLDEAGHRVRTVRRAGRRRREHSPGYQRSGRRCPGTDQPGPASLGPGPARGRLRAVRPGTVRARWSPRSTPDSPTRQAYAARFRLVHAWRTFLFRDPQLPARAAAPTLARRRRGHLLRPARGAGCARPPTGSSTPACTCSRQPDRL